MVSTAQASALADKIRITLAAPYQLKVVQTVDQFSTVEHRCSASIGVVMFLNHTSSQADLTKWADIAMYQAKDAGRNIVRFYMPNVPIAPVETALAAINKIAYRESV